MILALDPSIAKPGWAVFRMPERVITRSHEIADLYVDSGSWGTDAADDPASRLAYLMECCQRLCQEYPPTRAFVEEPATVSAYHRHANLSSEAKQHVVGAGIGTMQQAVGVFLAVLGSHCPTVTVKATNPAKALGLKGPKAAKSARRNIVASYWPHLADRSEDECDAIHLALTCATDARRRLWAVTVRTA